MTWLHNHGVTGNYEEYLALPLGVLEDARLLMDAENKLAELEAFNAQHR